jgi:hypothetical protein
MKRAKAKVKAKAVPKTGAPAVGFSVRMIGVIDAINEARQFARGLSTAVAGAAALSGDDHGLGAIVEAHICGLDEAEEKAVALHEAMKAESA